MRPNNSNKASPADCIESNIALSDIEQTQSIQMMRINHSGEICAQALYQGQAMFAKSNAQYQSLLTAAMEENDHLHWCKQRLENLNGRTSWLNPLWYAGSFGIGMLAGVAGDQISLGFLAETEKQVTRHLASHLAQMSHKDQKSRAILQQMQQDEIQHATNAIQAGGVELPYTIRFLMRATAKVLTITAAKI
jgi:ubiquinone biosynthesis monooxygenase Coq7